MKNNYIQCAVDVITDFRLQLFMNFEHNYFKPKQHASRGDIQFLFHKITFYEEYYNFISNILFLEQEKLINYLFKFVLFSHMLIWAGHAVNLRYLAFILAGSS